MQGVLDGIRVLDFGRYIAGPFCAALLGDLGTKREQRGLLSPVYLWNLLRP